MRLLVISSVIHYEWQGQISAYGPYAREIDIWADLFPQVGIAAPVRRQAPPGDCVAFGRQNIAMEPQKEVGGGELFAKLKLAANLPVLLWTISRAICRYDAVHVRCPGNLGLLGTLLAPLLSPRMVAKFAGQWNGYPGEPLSVRLQRCLLGSRYWKGPVTVYGRWPGQRRHVVPFFTSTMTSKQVERAYANACEKRSTSPLKILFVGRLSGGKNVDVLIEALAVLKTQNHKFSCVIVGEGPEQTRWKALAQERGVSGFTEFTGGVGYESVLQHMERANVLVLVSESEGWPKAIAEAMSHGLICIGSDRGFVPEMLDEGRGIVVPPRDAGQLAQKLAEIAADPEHFEIMQRRAAEWARRYSIEGLRDSLSALLAEHWDWSPRPLKTDLLPGTREAVR